MTDVELITRYKAGEPQAFDELVHRHVSSLYSFIYRYTPDSAEDISQEVWLKVWRHIERYNPEYSFKTWLFTIAKRTVFDHLKKRRVRLEDAVETLEEVASSEDLAKEVARRLDSQESLEKLWGTLTPKYRLVLELYYREEFNLSEIAQISGESVNTVKSRHRRALLLLRETLTSSDQRGKSV